MVAVSEFNTSPLLLIIRYVSGIVVFDDIIWHISGKSIVVVMYVALVFRKRQLHGNC
jgi:hypothetical protein